MRRRAFLSSVVGLLAVIIVLPAAAAAADRSVAIEGFAFAPGTVTIRAGDTVTWTNRDGVGHTATGDGWDTGIIEQDASASIRFDAPGTYAYICTPHPSMNGTVVVEAASSGGGGGSVTPPPADTAAGDTPVRSGGGGLEPGALAAILAGIFVLTFAIATVARSRRTARG